MIPLTETLTMLGGFFFSYFLLFVWIPSMFVRYEEDDSSRLDKLFIGLTHSTLFFMIVIHLLVAIRLLETISLIGITIACLIVVTKYYSRSKSITISIKMMTSLFDLTEDREQWKIQLRNLTNHFEEKFIIQFHEIKQAFVKHPVLVAAYLLVFGVAMIDRFRYSFTHLSFASSDSYVHLGWSKYLSDMTIYLDGVYPYGFESIISVIYEIFSIDMYVIIRFMGTLTSILMMFSLVYALRKMVGRDYITILLTVFLLFYSSSMMIGNSTILWRQLSALSMEFAAVFLLPGITFFYLYFKSNKRLYLLLAAECYAIAAFTHPFVVVTMTLAFIAMGMANFRKLTVNRTFSRIIIYMGVAGFVGILPPLIGLLMGNKFHGSSLNYIAGEFLSNGTSSAFQTVILFAREQPFIIGMFVVFAIYFTVWFINKKRHKNWFVSEDQSPFVMAAIFLVMMIIIYLSPALGLPSFVPIDRQPVFLAMAAALFFGIGSGLIALRINREKLRSSLQMLTFSAIILWVLLVPGQKMEFPPGDQHQYDEAIRAYLDIKANYPFKHWDIISPVDELGMIKGYGYHTELWSFVRDLDDATLPSIKFKTAYVFLFVEKIPIDIMNRDSQPFTRADADLPFPVATDSFLTEFYYGSNVQNRRILEAKAYYWAEEYMKHNKDMKVLLDTPNMKIYEVYQGKDEVILTKSKQVITE